MNAGAAVAMTVAASSGIDETPTAIATREAISLTRFERTLGLYLRAAWQLLDDFAGVLSTLSQNTAVSSRSATARLMLRRHC